MTDADERFDDSHAHDRERYRKAFLKKHGHFPDVLCHEADECAWLKRLGAEEVEVRDDLL